MSETEPKQQWPWKCPICRGTGDLRCGNCYGTGRVNAADYDVDFGHYRYRNIPCPECNGRGKRLCWECLGDGQVLRDTPPPTPQPPPLDTAEFNRQKRERDLAQARAKSGGNTRQKRGTIHGRSIPTVCTGSPSSLASRGMDDDERDWLHSIRRGSRMRGDDPDELNEQSLHLLARSLRR